MKRSTIVVTVLLSVVAISLIAIIIVALKNTGIGESTAASDDVIELISLNGAISEDAGSSALSTSVNITPDFVRHTFEEIEDDPSVKAIILKINSPGGTVGASQEIAYTIKNASIPVVVFTGDMVASGGYYISSQADKIVSKPGTLVGSIGVISEFPDLSGLYEKLGVKMQTIKSGKNKDMFSRLLTDEEREKFQALSDELYQQFVNDVAKGRKMKVSEVKQLATGEVFAATQAKKLGLVDEIGDYQTAIDVAAKLADIKDPTIVEYEPPSVFEALFGSSSYGMTTIGNLMRTQTLGRELLLLETVRNSYGTPQYRYYGGL